MTRDLHIRDSAAMTVRLTDEQVAALVDENRELTHALQDVTAKCERWQVRVIELEAALQRATLEGWRRGLVTEEEARS